MIETKPRTPALVRRRGVPAATTSTTCSEPMQAWSCTRTGCSRLAWSSAANATTPQRDDEHRGDRRGRQRLRGHHESWASVGVWLAESGLHLNSMLGESELLRGHEMPGQRMGSMMSPFIAFSRRGGRSWSAGPLEGVGSGRPSRRSSSTCCTGGMPVPEAISAPRLNPVPGTRARGARYAEAALSALAERDEVVIWPGLDSYFGGVAGIDEHGPGADPRRGGDPRPP